MSEEKLVIFKTLVELADDKDSPSRVSYLDESDFDEFSTKIVDALGEQKELRLYQETKQNQIITKQDKPVKGKSVILPLVLEDLRKRQETGTIKYGHPLESFNGRDALIDAYQEALDLCMYLRQEIEERKGRK